MITQEAFNRAVCQCLPNSLAKLGNLDTSYQRLVAVAREHGDNTCVGYHFRRGGRPQLWVKPVLNQGSGAELIYLI